MHDFSFINPASVRRSRIEQGGKKLDGPIEYMIRIALEVKYKNTRNHVNKKSNVTRAIWEGSRDQMRHQLQDDQ